MKRIASGLGHVVGLVLWLAFPAHADQTVATVSKNGDVELRALTRIGPATLIPGLYAIRYVEIDDQPYVIVHVRKAIRAGATRSNVSIETGGEVARVLCAVVPLDHEPKTSEIGMRVTKTGAMAVTQIRIQAEKGRIVALAPRQQE